MPTDSHRSSSPSADPTLQFGEFLVGLGLVTEGQLAEAIALQPGVGGAQVGEALLSLGYLTRPQLQRALSAALSRGETLILERPPLGEILVGLKYIDSSALGATLERQRREGRRLGELLIDAGACTPTQVFEALTLQQRMGTRPDAPPKPAVPVPLVASGRRVVIIDDSELACGLVQEGLGLHGYDVIPFTDPLIALEQLDLLRPDLVLSDLDMPGLDGGEVCKRIKTGPHRETPVLILTANGADARRVMLLRAGADDFVHKGASMDELAARIETVLRRTTQTERMRRLFARYTSDAVVEEVLRKGEVALLGEKRIVTVLFADIRNFTGFAETLPPEEVLTTLNEVLGRLADLVLAWGGTLDKYMGDGLMAVWGAPIRHDDDVNAAVSAAMHMMTATRERNATRSPSERIELGLGLNTGPVVAGSVGSSRRMEYTCIGDTVNVASRLCALAGPGEILVGGGTAEILRQLAPLDELPPVRVKGRAAPIPIFKITGQLQTALDSLRRF